MNFKVVKLVYL